MNSMEKRINCVMVLDDSYIESFQLYDSLENAKKSFKKHLRDRGLGILKQRKHLREEFFREGNWQVQLIKKDLE